MKLVPVCLFHVAEKDSKDIWDEEEVQEGAEFESMYDPRPQPEYVTQYNGSARFYSGYNSHFSSNQCTSTQCTYLC